MERDLRQSGFQKGIAARDLLHLIAIAQDDRRGESKAVFDLLAENIGKAFRNLRRRGEDHVAALNIAAHVDALGLGEHLDQLLHGQDVLAANIDAAQQRDPGVG